LLNKDNLFREPAAVTRAKTTHNIAMGIIEDETTARDKKTRKLRAARIELEESEKVKMKAMPQGKSARKKPKS